MIKNRLSKTRATLLTRTVTNRDRNKCRPISIVGPSSICFNIDHDGFKQHIFDECNYPIIDNYTPTYGISSKADYTFGLKYKTHQNIQSIKRRKEANDVFNPI